MSSIRVEQTELARFGEAWRNNGGRLSRTPPQSSSQLGNLFDAAVGVALATMLGGIPIVRPTSTALTASVADCVEVGPVRIIGGVRPQNFDVGYRPDGVRFAFDSKTLNDADSLRKNWQNMINDLATEATTVHSRFPHAVVAFMVIIPTPCLVEPQRAAMIETLERLARRIDVEQPAYMAEAISLVLWNPDEGSIDVNIPQPTSPLRLEHFSTYVEAAYVNRYKGLPPHAVAE
ncbi:MAG TPA: hypothetical protein VM911_08655 [Pyrinomonadaceae bacterium]|nr:hypothetical protein [Pyrinomonadaceae bacterium]